MCARRRRAEAALVRAELGPPYAECDEGSKGCVGPSGSVSKERVEECTLILNVG